MHSRSRRLLTLILGTVIIGAVLTPSATAQYSESTTTTRPTTVPTTTTRPEPTSSTTQPDDDEETTTSTTEPEVIEEQEIPGDEDNEIPDEEPVAQPASISDAEPEPGDSVVVAAGGGGASEAFPAGESVIVEVKPGTKDAAPLFTVGATVNADGTVSVSVDVPIGTPPGVYYVAIVLPAVRDANGNVTRRPQVAITAFTVLDDGQDQAGASAETPVTTVPDPKVAAARKEAMTPAVEALFDRLTEQIEAAGEATILAQVADGAHLAFDGVQLVLDGRPVGAEESESGRAINAALALGIAGAGLLLIRRRSTLGAAR